MDTKLGLTKISSGSIYPKFTCSICKEALWTERSERTNWNEWLVTENGKRHYKTKCNLSKN